MCCHPMEQFIKNICILTYIMLMQISRDLVVLFSRFCRKQLLSGTNLDCIFPQPLSAWVGFSIVFFAIFGIATRCKLWYIYHWKPSLVCRHLFDKIYWLSHETYVCARQFVMHCIVVIFWLILDSLTDIGLTCCIYTYSSESLHRHWGNHVIAPMPVKSNPGIYVQNRL